jgi:hypothetical protein
MFHFRGIRDLQSGRMRTSCDDRSLPRCVGALKGRWTLSVSEKRQLELIAAPYGASPLDDSFLRELARKRSLVVRASFAV